MKNDCVFSADRRHRYRLVHSWADDLFVGSKRAAWIGLNPSTADERQLDPTLRRIKGFSQILGCNSFVMLNLFAFRSTSPKGLLSCPDPTGPDNDRWISETAAECDYVIAAWGNHGRIESRAEAVIKLLSGIRLHCVKRTSEGFPGHPLYVPYPTAKDDSFLIPFP